MPIAIFASDILVLFEKFPAEKHHDEMSYTENSGSPKCNNSGVTPFTQMNSEHTTDWNTKSKKQYLIEHAPFAATAEEQTHHHAHRQLSDDISNTTPIRESSSKRWNDDE